MFTALLDATLDQLPAAGPLLETPLADIESAYRRWRVSTATDARTVGNGGLSYTAFAALFPETNEPLRAAFDAMAHAAPPISSATPWAAAVAPAGGGGPGYVVTAPTTTAAAAAASATPLLPLLKRLPRHHHHFTMNPSY